MARSKDAPAGERVQLAKAPAASQVSGSQHGRSCLEGATLWPAKNATTGCIREDASSRENGAAVDLGSSPGDSTKVAGVGVDDDTLRTGTFGTRHRVSDREIGTQTDMAAVLSRQTESSRVRTGTPAWLITRERQVLDALCSGQSCKQIANSLDISESTVRWYLASAKQKLNAANGAHASALWTELKLAA